jgi:hypothetical protein
MELNNKYNKIMKNCIELYLNKINKLYKNIKKLNTNNFILYFLTNDLDLKNYKKIVKNNRILYINNQYDDSNNQKYNYYFSFDRSNTYILFSLIFTYKNKINLNIYTIKSRILENRYNFNNKNILFSNIYNLKLKEINKSLLNIQYKLAETLAEFIDINLILLKN